MNMGTIGKQFSSLILSTPHRFWVEMILCMVQGHDSADKYFGLSNGEAKIIYIKFSKQLYFHCACHELNMCLDPSC